MKKTPNQFIIRKDKLATKQNKKQHIKSGSLYSEILSNIGPFIDEIENLGHLIVILRLR